MRELAILTFITLDGVMQAPSDPTEDQTGGFSFAGWANPYWEGVMAQVKHNALSAPYDILFGRRTYEIFSGADTGARENPLRDARKYVVTSSLSDLQWPNSTAIRDNIPTEVRKLKSERGPLVQVHGSWQLIQLLLKHDLVDEMRLWVFPVTLGAGKKLFSDDIQMRSFDLLKSEPTGNGAVMNIYRRAQT